jgi:hypothetical protein
LAAACICAVHLVDRMRGLIGGKADTDILEAGLILIVVISIASVGPAVWSQNAQLLREYVLQLLLAAIAIALCLIERSYETDASDTPADDAALAAAEGGSFTPWHH